MEDNKQALEFPKAYDPTTVEKRLYDFWQDKGFYKADSKSVKPKYSILMPPPNVTGILHFGHVLNITLQDLYLRWKRMSGYEAVWFPGTDHAGIATQTKVEVQLKNEGLTKYDLGREKFLERVWRWRERYGGIILNQLRFLGVSCDWDRTLFTMDESASNAVREVFVRLYDEGLIYKGQRIINWSPLAQTALSDEEVEFREVKEHLYTMRYRFVKDASKYLQVATVRPETIFGDIAAAVNPNDERYKDLIGEKVYAPLSNREIPVIPDDYADPEFGTGCVKITPAHDPNDFEVGKRHDLEIINTINPDGTLNEKTGEFDGLERFAARKKILAKLESEDLIEKIEDYVHNVGFSQRGGEPVEPYLSDQWFVKMKPLAERALKVVLDGEVKFYPSHWIKTYEHWMTNIRDWCISRQLWWGHRIPVYYSEDGRHTAASDENQAREKLGLASDAPIRQEEDVLDTWFSSWLWPLTTMRWLHDGESESSDDLEAFLPTDLLVTAPDIIFFWVARMIMATEKFKGEIPFKDVYFTSTIRDGIGRKLSKSLGNSPDPINIINKYGSDAVRFTMIYLSPLGQDIKMDVDVKAQDIPSIELGRNFANKIWNAGRFLMMKAQIVDLPGCCPSNEGRTLTADELSFADKWILSRFHSTVKNVIQTLENYKVNDYSKILYDFIWRDFCDWYVEIVKVRLNETDTNWRKQAIMRFAVDIYERILRLIHPIMPFISEEIWHIIDKREEDETISTQEFPALDEASIDPEVESRFDLMQKVVEEIRKLRANVKIPPHQKVPVTISCSTELAELFENQKPILAELGKCSRLTIGTDLAKPDKSLASVVREIGIYLEPGEAIDLDAERGRMEKEIKRLEGNIKGSEKKLGNEKFVNNAPEKVVAYEKEKLESMKNSLKEVKANLESIS